jgi:hypothetical protein
MNPIRKQVVLENEDREEVQKVALSLQDYLDSIKIENLKNKR